jgi:hypothetical protein
VRFFALAASRRGTIIRNLAQTFLLPLDKLAECHTSTLVIQGLEFGKVLNKWYSILVANVDVEGLRKFFHRIAQVILHMPCPPFGATLLIGLLPQNLFMQRREDQLQVIRRQGGRFFVAVLLHDLQKIGFRCLRLNRPRLRATFGIGTEFGVVTLDSRFYGSNLRVQLLVKIIHHIPEQFDWVRPRLAKHVKVAFIG